MKIFKRIIIGLVIVIAVLFSALLIYSRNPYQSLDAMDDNIANLDLSTVTFYEDRDEISYSVSNPIKNIVFIPGGLVEPDSYQYLAASLAVAGYDVTIAKANFDLAILTPSIGKEFLSKDVDNIVIGHSLGGVVASMLAFHNDLVGEVILLGSYPIKDLNDKDVLIITAEHDDGMDPDKFNASLEYVNDDAIIFHILGGNHGQFGWYGPQEGDGEATITTLEQQNIVVAEILSFIVD